MTKREPLDLDEMRENFADDGAQGTHGAECVYWHEGCAIIALMEEVEDLRETVERQRREIERLRGLTTRSRVRAAR